jgi:putative membrane protein
MPYLTDLVRGLLMGSVYLVPGGDGGTVALVLGIYERLIRSLHAGAAALGLLLRMRWRQGWERLREV